MPRAVLIIDMQEAMRSVVWRFEELSERIAALARAARQSGAPIIAVQQTGATGIAV